MLKAVAFVVNGAAPNSIVVNGSVVVVHPPCDCRFAPVAIVENELTKTLDTVECSATTPRAAALQRFLVIMPVVSLLEVLLELLVLEIDLLYSLPRLGMLHSL